MNIKNYIWKIVRKKFDFYYKTILADAKFREKIIGYEKSF